MYTTMATLDSYPDLSQADRLAGMAEHARRRGLNGCADRLLLLAWAALDYAERDEPKLAFNVFRSQPPQA